LWVIFLLVYLAGPKVALAQSGLRKVNHIIIMKENLRSTLSAFFTGFIAKRLKSTVAAAKDNE